MTEKTFTLIVTLDDENVDISFKGMNWTRVEVLGALAIITNDILNKESETTEN